MPAVPGDALPHATCCTVRDALSQCNCGSVLHGLPSRPTLTWPQGWGVPYCWGSPRRLVVSHHSGEKPRSVPCCTTPRVMTVRNGRLTNMCAQGPADAAQQLRAAGAPGVASRQPGRRQQGGAAADAALRHPPAARPPQQRSLLVIGQHIHCKAQPLVRARHTHCVARAPEIAPNLAADTALCRILL